MQVALSPRFLKAALMLTLLAWLTGCIGPGINTPIERLMPDQFPHVAGTSLLGDEVVLPEGFEGDVNLVSMGFVDAHQNDIDTWIAALPELQAELPDLRFYEVPVIYEGSAVFRWWLNNGMRIGVVEEEARRRTVTVYTDRDQFVDAVGIPDIERIHTLLLDGDGHILWQAPGPVSEAAKADVRRITREQLEQLTSMRSQAAVSLASTR